jgi:hypothetical protein
VRWTSGEAALRQSSARGCLASRRPGHRCPNQPSHSHTRQMLSSTVLAWAG